MWTKRNVSHEAVRGSHHRIQSLVPPKTTQAQVENRTFNIKMMIIAAVANGFVCLAAGRCNGMKCSMCDTVSTFIRPKWTRQSPGSLDEPGTILFLLRHRANEHSRPLKKWTAPAAIEWIPFSFVEWSGILLGHMKYAAANGISTDIIRNGRAEKNKCNNILLRLHISFHFISFRLFFIILIFRISRLTVGS